MIKTYRKVHNKVEVNNERLVENFQEVYNVVGLPQDVHINRKVSEPFLITSLVKEGNQIKAPFQRSCKVSVEKVVPNSLLIEVSSVILVILIVLDVD